MMIDKTPDALHKALTGQIIRLDAHKTTPAVVCMRCEPVVITCLRSMPSAPQTWYSSSDTAYLVKANDAERLATGLRSFGAVVLGDAAPAEPSSGPSSSRATGWCGECDTRTRLRRKGDTLTRCPVCHPLRAEPVPTQPAEPRPAMEVYQAGMRAVRAELARARAAWGDDEARPF